MMTYTDDQVKRMALHLARANKLAEPSISKIYWFRANNEIRLVEVEHNIPPSETDTIEPFYFASSPTDRLLVPMAIGLISPSEDDQTKKLPDGWGDWTTAEVWDDEDLKKSA